VELDEERRKREAVEEELRKVKEQLAKQQKDHDDQRELEEMDADIRESKQIGASTQHTATVAELQKRLQILQADFYKARGEVASVRRAQTDVSRECGRAGSRLMHRKKTNTKQRRTGTGRSSMSWRCGSRRRIERRQGR
jgi:uncharacterized protein YpuA (DUF1002 family)